MQQKATLLDRFFTLAVIAKGIDGVIETAGGALLVIIPIGRLHGLAATAIYELHQDNHAFIANSVINLDKRLTPGFALFGALYLLIHGIIKIGLVIALLSRRYSLYPYAIVILILFTLYQVYEFGYNHSFGLGALTVFDIAVVVLTYIEWKRHTSKRHVLTHRAAN